MSKDSEISKDLDSGIQSNKGTGEPLNPTENGINGHQPANDGQEDSAKQEPEASQENSTSENQPSGELASKEVPSEHVSQAARDKAKPNLEAQESEKPENLSPQEVESAENEEEESENSNEAIDDSEEAQEITPTDPTPNTAEAAPAVTATESSEQSEAKAEEAEKKPTKPWDGVDFNSLDKDGLVNLIELLVKEEDPVSAQKISVQLKERYDAIHEVERKEAQDKFVAEGNDADHFAYKFDDLDNRFDGAYKLIRDKKSQHFKNLERNKEKNLAEKIALLEELRAFVDGVETTSSIQDIKKIQETWKLIGPVPGQHVKTLWANYHALMDRYYDQRSIYYELKELDRRKNLEAKLELCAKAEKLVSNKNLKQAISELNELHEEFKHIGPVPKESQQQLWEKFKGASDQIYARRKEFIKHLKHDLQENLVKKKSLAEEVQQFLAYESKKISDWNKKTKEILELQTKWEAIGGLPREQAKEVNRKFWGAFKGFFHNKGQFFKELEGERVVNLEKKKELVKQADSLKDNTSWEETANKLKELQKEWKNIGPVPEKYRNSIYAEFKQACDTFFNNRRQQNKQSEEEYIENLQKKQQICVQIESMTTASDYDLDKFLELKKRFEAIGYVPASEVRNIRSQFIVTSEDFLSSVPEEFAEEANQIRYDIQFEKLKKGPNANRKIEQKEQVLRRDIGTLENDIATWKNNLEFFANSKTADKLKEEFTVKIDEAVEKLQELKSQLRAVRQL